MSKPISKGSIQYIKLILEEFLIKIYEGKKLLWSLGICNWM